ncbi:MAG: NAD(P)H-dependent oxidoreductase [Candidatus Eisenbacteria bacterium]|nr:NAD(P)H-dependent oxidoreductase [Candidatus Eisenbacteria bacterium]
MSVIAQLSSLRAIGLSASPGGASSRSHQLLAAALARLGELGFAGAIVDLAAFPADALLGRARDRALDRAIADLAAAQVVVVATPVYRASYSGLLKVFLDQLDEDALAGKVAVPIASGGGPAHLLAIDHGLRPLLTSLGATVVAAGVYATPAGFTDGVPGGALLDRLDRALTEAVTLATAAITRRDFAPAAAHRHAPLALER